MTFSLGQEKQLIQWNGISIKVPVSWEAIVSGNKHLVFEEDFHPVLEIRWEKAVATNSSSLSKLLNRWKKQLPVGMQEAKLSSQQKGLNDNFDHTSYFVDEKSGQCSGISYSKAIDTVVLFQLPAPADKKETAMESLQSLRCHPSSDNHYRIQDFSVVLPPGYDLEHYSFMTALTTLSFTGKKHKLQVCRLAQASKRLSAHPLEVILTTLCGSKDIDIREQNEKRSCLALREPALIRQMVMRLKRQPPFLRAGLRHLPESDRLFGFVVTGNSPIPEDLQQTIYENFKPVQKK